MKPIYVLAILLSIALISINAQNSPVIDNSKFSSLSFVYGWYKNPKNGKWTTKDSEIKDIDKFSSYTIFATAWNSQKLVCIMKLATRSSFYIYDLYFVDYDDYKSQITKWEENTILRFPIVKHVNIEEKKKLNSISLEGIDFTDQKDSDSATNFFVFQYKFDYDNTVKFLFYTEECSDQRCQFAGLNGQKAAIHKPLLATDALFDNFFYKTMHKHFVDFTDAPLQ